MTGANLKAWVSVCDKVKKLHLLKLSIISLLSSGAIELSILSKHYQAQIAVVDTESGRVDRFGKTYINLLHRCICNYRRVGEVLYIYFQTVRKIVYMAENKCRHKKKWYRPHNFSHLRTRIIMYERKLTVLC